jgi:hypothetical protein
MGHLEAVMITDVNKGLRAVSAKPLVRAAEARGFEPRMGANPNRISSPFAAAKAPASLPSLTESPQVRVVSVCKPPEPATTLRKLRCAISVPVMGPYATPAARPVPQAIRETETVSGVGTVFPGRPPGPPPDGRHAAAAELGQAPEHYVVRPSPQPGRSAQSAGRRPPP